MRQHVNPLSSNFNQIERIPSLSDMFGNSKLYLHLDIGCAAGEFLFDLALVNTSWNYLGIEIREKLVKNAKLKVIDKEIKNLYFLFDCQIFLKLNFPLLALGWLKGKHRVQIHSRSYLRPRLNLLHKAKRHYRL